MTMITPSYLGETIEYSSLHACRSTLEDPTFSHSPVLFPPQRYVDSAVVFFSWREWGAKFSMIGAVAALILSLGPRCISTK